MKTRLSLLIVAFALVLGSSLTWAAIDKNALIGTWQGNLFIHFHGNVKSMPVEVVFAEDGAFKLTLTDKGKSDQAQFKVEGDRLLITDGKGKDSYITDVVVTKDKFEGRFETPEQSARQGLSLKLVLKRKK